MADENYTFTQARTRLEEIVTQVRSKDVSLEKSLDLLEEGVRLANICTEQSDHTEWRSVIGDEDGGAEGGSAAAESGDESPGADASDTPGATVDGENDTEAVAADAAEAPEPASEADDMAAEGESTEETPAEASASEAADEGDDTGADSDESGGDTSEEGA
jgi:exodeoxyribonuclease VII small subunit